MYMGYVQFFLIIIVFLKSLEPNPISDLISDYSFISISALLVLFVLISLVIGYLDSKLGLREEEMRNFSKSNPVLKDIQKSLDELSERVEKLSEKSQK